MSSAISLSLLTLILLITKQQVHCGKAMSLVATSSSDESGEEMMQDDGKIFFPGQMQEVNVSSRSQSHCVDNFCDHLDHYPEEFINRMLMRDAKYHSYFNYDLKVPDEGFIFNRAQFDYSKEDSLCASSIEARYPKTGVNTNNTRRIIVNTDGYKQMVMTEVCNTDAKCQFSDSFPLGYQASCKQKYIRRRLVSMDENSKVPFVDIYDIPCCCVCSIKKTNGG